MKFFKKDTLFQKDIEPLCIYCQKSMELNEDRLMCSHHGVVSFGHHCRKFLYDPLKRVPTRPLNPDFSRFKDEDFRF